MIPDAALIVALLVAALVVRWVVRRAGRDNPSW